jgi:hypothetical protein
MLRAERDNKIEELVRGSARGGIHGDAVHEPVHVSLPFSAPSAFSVLLCTALTLHQSTCNWSLQGSIATPMYLLG